MAKAKFQKGARVEIVDGRSGVGVSGEIFWKGESRYTDGERLGVRGDDGETYWVDDSEVQAATGEAPKQDAGPTFDKGDRVSFRDRGRDGTGTVFWIGQSRQGPGQRLGVRDDDAEGEDNAVWLDARLCKPSDTPAPEGSERPARSSGRSTSSGADIPPAPPMDDSMADSYAASSEDGDAIPW